MEVLSEIRNHVAFVTLNRPAALNALSFTMLRELQSTLRTHARDSEVRAVVLRGAGEKAFCAGGDIRALYESFTGGGSLHHEFFVAEYALDHALYAYPKPYIVLLDGITMGGGLGLAQASKLRVVGDTARMAMPEVGIGLFPDVGGSYFLSRLPGALGAFLALTGTQIRGPDALYCRLADVCASSAGIAALPQALTDLQWSADWAADIRNVVYGHAAQGLSAPTLSVLRPAIDEHFGKPSVTAIEASLRAETRPEFAEWAAATLKTLGARSPTMVSVTLEQLKRGAQLSLAECFRMELGMVEQCFVQGDFIEGVRALIIDKDNAPRWSPAALADVQPQAVDAFFKPRWSDRAHPLADIERRDIFQGSP
jgi:enoyl-CoA hydratase/carnithine racemase